MLQVQLLFQSASQGPARLLSGLRRTWLWTTERGLNALEDQIPTETVRVLGCK